MSTPIPAEVAAVQEAWRQRGRLVALPDGHRLFVVQEGSGPDLLLAHGFPSTSHDFAAAWPALTARYRVTVFDHLGFGFSDKPASASYSLLDQGRRAGELARALGIQHAYLLGHDMGLTIAVEMLCRAETTTLGFSIDRLVLCNGSHLVELAHLTPFQQMILSDEGAQSFCRSFDAEAFATGLEFLWGHGAPPPKLELRAIAYWLAAGEGLAVFPKIAKYNLERTTYAERWRSILTRTAVPIRVVWGDRDPIAVFEIGQRLAAMGHAPLTVLDGVGHYPQLEAPERWAQAVLAALA